MTTDRHTQGFVDLTHFNSPLGTLELAADSVGVLAIRFPSDGTTGTPAAEPANPHLQQLRDELEAYFAGHLTHFTCSLHPIGTDFQLRVWSALQQIPFGQTINYGELARRIHQPTASRAVGGANNRNPLSIVVPCHRVIGKDLSMVGYGGELWRKQWLLEHEGIALPLA